MGADPTRDALRDALAVELDKVILKASEVVSDDGMWATHHFKPREVRDAILDAFLVIPRTDRAADDGLWPPADYHALRATDLAYFVARSPTLRRALRLVAALGWPEDGA